MLQHVGLQKRLDFLSHGGDAGATPPGWTVPLNRDRPTVLTAALILSYVTKYGRECECKGITQQDKSPG